MKKNGFTLVELIAVITVLVILGLIASTTITKIVANAKQSGYDKQIEQIKEAYRLFVNDNLEYMPQNTESLSITLYQLKQYNYIDFDLVNPKDGSQIPNDSYITVFNNDGKFDYSFTLGNNNTPISENDIYIKESDLVKHLNQDDEYIVNSNDIIGNSFTVNDTLIEKITYDYSSKQLTYETVSSIDTSQFAKYRITYVVNYHENMFTLMKSVIVRDYIEPVLSFDSGTCKTTLNNIEASTYDFSNCVTGTDNDNQIVRITYKGNIASRLGKQYITYVGTDTSGNKTILRKAFTIEQAPTCLLAQNFNSQLADYFDENDYSYNGEIYCFGNDPVCENAIAIDEDNGINQIIETPIDYTEMKPAPSGGFVLTDDNKICGFKYNFGDEVAYQKCDGNNEIIISKYLTDLDINILIQAIQANGISNLTFNDANNGDKENSNYLIKNDLNLKAKPMYYVDANSLFYNYPFYAHDENDELCFDGIEEYKSFGNRYDYIDLLEEKNNNYTKTKPLYINPSTNTVDFVAKKNSPLMYDDFDSELNKFFIEGIPTEFTEYIEINSLYEPCVLAFGVSSLDSRFDVSIVRLSDELEILNYKDDYLNFYDIYLIEEIGSLDEEKDNYIRNISEIIDSDQTYYYKVTISYNGE